MSFSSIVCKLLCVSPVQQQRVLHNVADADFHVNTRPRAFISFSLFGNPAEMQVLVFDDTDCLSVVKL